MCDRLGEIRISAKLLAEADEHESLDDAVKVASHGEPSVARESLSPAAKLPPGWCRSERQHAANRPRPRVNLNDVC